MPETATRQKNTPDSDPLTKEEVLAKIKEFLDSGEEPTPEIRELFYSAISDDEDAAPSPEVQAKRVEAFDAWVAKHSRPYNLPETAFHRENWY